MGYGGTRFPHVDQRPSPFMWHLSRALMFKSAFMLFARLVDWFLSFYLGGLPLRTPLPMLAVRRGNPHR